MKRKMPVLCLLAAALVGLALLAGCGAKAQPVHITVVNRTTLPLGDLRIKLVSEESWGENRLETTLQEGETAVLDLGRYTQAQLDGGCNLQFYDETGEPVYPEYDPDTVTLVESGNVFILAPPNLSVTLFVDNSYDPAAYDEKIAALYDLADDGRGDVIPQGSIPVLQGGALPFTNMQNLLTENYEDGTYRYEDLTEDGQLLVVNTAEPSCFAPDVQSLQEYLTACALSLSDSQTNSLLSAEENEEYSRNLSYPVYVVTYTAGENEDTRQWTVFAMDTDLCTYLYGFCASPDAAKDAMETYQSIFSQLYLSDGE